MATSKQPRFPHPPLEQGIAQYPTPAIPDFITQSGHIILVEKVSAEKGSYTPRQPAVTDASPVIYTGRDAKKWPSNLYLVHERPDETGEFVYRYWANDRSLSSQDPWNYGISYDGGDPFYPTYTREYIVPRSQYTAVPVGGKDPVFGAGQPVTLNVSGTTATITGTNFSYAKGANIYVYTQSTTTQTTQQKYALGSFTLLTASATTLTYAVQSGATNPSVPIFINPTVISEQEMTPLGEDNPLRSRYVKVKRVYEPIPSTVLTTNVNKAGLMGSTAKTDQLVTAATNPNELSLNLSGESILQSSVEHVSANKSNLTNIITDGPYSLFGKSLNKFGTTETITESIVAPTTTPETTGVGLLLSDDITPIDSTKSQRKQVVLDAVPPSLVVYESTQDNSIVQNVTSYLSRNISSGLGAFVPPNAPTSQVVLPTPTAASGTGGFAILTFSSLQSVVVGDVISISGYTTNGWTNGKYTATAVSLTAPFTITLSLAVTGSPTASSPVVTQNNNRLLQTSDADIGFPWVRRTNKYLPSVNGSVQLPPSRTEYKTAQFSFPGLIYTWGDTSSTTSATFAFPRNRLPLDITCTQKHIYTYSETMPNLSALKFFKVVTQPWAIKFFGIPKNTIHPPAPAALQNESSDQNGVNIGIFGGEASYPTAYKVGQQILIGADAQLWQGGIYVQRLIYTQEPTP
jgi:hypothetical protein